MTRLASLRLLPLCLLLGCGATGGANPDGGGNGPEITPEYCESQGLVYTSSKPVCGPSDAFLGTEKACVSACDTGFDCVDGAYVGTCG